MANSWKQDDAKRPAEIAQAFLNGGRVQAGSANPAMLERWRQRSAS